VSAFHPNHEPVPIDCQTYALVCREEGYCFREFICAGLPLNFILWILACRLTLVSLAVQSVTEGHWTPSVAYRSFSLVNGDFQKADHWLVIRSFARVGNYLSAHQPDIGGDEETINRLFFKTVENISENGSNGA